MSDFIDDQEIEKLSPKERELLEKILKEQKENGISITHGTLLNSIYDEIPVDPMEFIESSKYLGLKDVMFNRIKYLFCEIDDDEIREAWLALGRGSGKSYLSSALTLRSLYRLLCLKSPQKYFNIAPETEIVSINVSVNASQAKRVIFKTIVGRLAISPWFEGKYEVLTAEVRFPEKNIMAYAGNSSSPGWLGYSFIHAILDEADWFVDNQNRSNAQELLDTLIGSLRTRWQDAGKLIVISSPASDSGFIMENIARLRKDKVKDLNLGDWPKERNV